MKIEGKAFVDQIVLLDGHEYVNCTFKRVVFYYAGILGVGLIGGSFENCRWEFTGPAASTTAFLSGLYNSGDETSRLIVENTFDVIRKGSGDASQHSPVPYKPTIFIGHGRSSDYESLSNWLQQQGYKVETFESTPRAGMSVKEVLQMMSSMASMAFLVHTAEDESGNEIRARQNVVHETGLFQGSLGFERAIVMREDPCEPFSNMDGVQEIRYEKGAIKGTFLEVLQTIQREFPASV